MTQLIIFDLDGVLIKRKCGTGKAIGRPGARELLSKLRECYQIGIWTCAQRKNAMSAIHSCFGPYFLKSLFCVLTQEDAIFNGRDVNGKPRFLKSAEVIRDKYGIQPS
jgi:hypothetical protein